MDMKICIASSEISSFAGTGGLGEVSNSIGKFLGRYDGNVRHDVRMFMPFYQSLDVREKTFYIVNFIHNVPIQMADRTLYFTAITTKLPSTNVDVYLIDCPELYNRPTLYTSDGDEYVRFAFFNRAVIECCQRMAWSPHVFHCNDWQTGLLPLYLKTLYGWDSLFRSTKTLFTIHNIGYQGTFPADAIPKIGLGPYYGQFPYEDRAMGVLNFLRTGLFHADCISTVSERYATEIQTPTFGSGMQGLIRRRNQDMYSIVNGIDYDFWDTEKDPHILHPYSVTDLSGKDKNKRALLEKLNLSFNAQAPVYAIISRLNSQKGLELLIDLLFPILEKNDIRFVVLGGGESRYEMLFSEAQRYFPNKLAFFNKFDLSLEHLIHAGSDILLMPSLYEPCGLTQLHSMRYGTVPIVRKVGGLADTVSHWNASTHNGTGFVFEDFDANGLMWAFRQAQDAFQDQNAWRQLMINGMSQNYSWDLQIQKYVELYQRLLQH